MLHKEQDCSTERLKKKEKNMEWLKKWLNRVFIDGLSGMALGLFSTLIVGTIIQQVGTLIGGQVGEITYLAGKLAAAMTSAGIGVGVAYKFKEPPLVVLSAATAGMAGRICQQDFSWNSAGRRCGTAGRTGRTAGCVYCCICGH